MGCIPDDVFHLIYIFFFNCVHFVFLTCIPVVFLEFKMEYMRNTFGIHSFFTLRKFFGIFLYL